MKKKIVVGIDESKRKIYLDIEVREKQGEFKTVEHTTITNPQVLTISGYAKRRYSSDLAYGGQIYDELNPDNIARYIMPKEALDELVSIWKEWHLNDMSSSCIHQKDWDTQEKLTVTPYKWTHKFYHEQNRAGDGLMSVEEYEQFAKIALLVSCVTTNTKKPKYETDDVKALLNDGWIEQGKSEVKTAGWVHEYEHPKGVLGKAADDCPEHYEYGSAWLVRELPESVINRLEELIKQAEED